MSIEEDDRPVTIYTVAEHAGVSIATVSRVLQGSARSSPLTRQKVLRAVEELDYVPLRAARTLDVKRHEAHGLVLPGLTGPYFAELLAGYESTAAQYGQSVVVVLSSSVADLDTTLRTLLARVDGLVLTHGTASDDFIRTLADKTPTVVLAHAPIEGCDTVTVENRESAAELTTHLAGPRAAAPRLRGRPGDVPRHPRALRRVRRRARGGGARRGRAAPAGVVRGVLGPGDRRGAARGARRGRRPRLRQRRAGAGHHEPAVAAAGVRVPDDLAIVGFDDIMASRYVEPGLTTVKQPTHGSGRWAAIRLHERIQGRTRDVQPQILPTQVVLRGLVRLPVGRAGHPAGAAMRTPRPNPLRAAPTRHSVEVHGREVVQKLNSYWTREVTAR